MSQVERIARIHLMLQSKRALSRREIEAMLKVSAETVTRDIEYMRDVLGVPILYDRAYRMYVYAKDADLLVFMKELLIIQNYVMRGFDKKVEIDLPRFVAPKPAIVRKIFRATLKELPVVIVTRRAGHSVPTEVIPLKLLLKEAGWTLHARNLDSQQTEDIPISGIESVANASGGDPHQGSGGFNAPELRRDGRPDMNFGSPDEYGQYEFCGGIPIHELRNGLDIIPREPGVYLVARSPQMTCEVMQQSRGGSCDGPDPTQDVDMLRARLRRCGESPVMYIGMTRKTLRDRIAQYLRFGVGQGKKHWGGRYIWQLAEAESLLVFWRPEPCDEPRDVERRLIRQHEGQFGWLPFANLVY